MKSSVVRALAYKRGRGLGVRLSVPSGSFSPLSYFTINYIILPKKKINNPNATTFANLRKFNYFRHPLFLCSGKKVILSSPGG